MPDLRLPFLSAADRPGRRHQKGSANKKRAANMAARDPWLLPRQLDLMRKVWWQLLQFLPMV